MGCNDVTHIMVGDNRIGIVGLQAALEFVIRSGSRRSDEDSARELMAIISKRNYIPDAAREAYHEALLREYRRFRDNPDEAPAASEAAVLLLGPGCARCNQLERDVRDVMAELGIAAELQLVRDQADIERWGVSGTPALVVRGRVVSVGGLPDRNQLKAFLADLSEGCAAP